MGRDCIEKKSIHTFNCSVTCEGVYADVHWITDIINEDELEYVEEDDDIKLMTGDVGDELKKMQKQLANMKLMYKSLKKEMEDSFGFLSTKDSSRPMSEISDSILKQTIQCLVRANLYMTYEFTKL